MNNTAARTLAILDLVSSAGHPMSLKQISDALKAPVSSTHDIVNTMLQLGFLQQKDAGVKLYSIGLKTYKAGVAYIRNIDFVDIARPYLEKMSEETASTAFLAVQNKDKIVYLDKVESSYSVRTTAVLGSSKGMYYTGLGKALLASIPPDEVREMYAGRTLQPLTPYTITDIDALEKELMQTRMRGYAVDDREGETMLYCVAAPIRDARNKPVAAISVACFRDLVDEEDKQRNAQMVLRYAAKISARLGCPMR